MKKVKGSDLRMVLGGHQLGPGTDWGGVSV